MGERGRTGGGRGAVPLPGVRGPGAVAVLLLAATMAAGCGTADAETAARAAWMRELDAAELDLALGRWEEAGGHYEEALRVPLPGRELRGSAAAAARVVAFYNLACARALAGKRTAAMDALRSALSANDGVLTRDHALEDPDLDSLRESPEFLAVAGPSPDDIRRLRPEGAKEGETRPLAVVLSGQGVAAGDGIRDEVSPRDFEPDAEVLASGCDAAVVLAPWRSGSAPREWATRIDAGAEAARVAAVAAGGRTDAILVARGPAPVAAAWEVLLRDPSPYAAAVLDGPAPPLPTLLDRTEALRCRGTRVYLVGAASRPAAPSARVSGGSAGGTDMAAGDDGAGGAATESPDSRPGGPSGLALPLATVHSLSAGLQEALR